MGAKGYDELLQGSDGSVPEARHYLAGMDDNAVVMAYGMDCADVEDERMPSNLRIE